MSKKSILIILFKEHLGEGVMTSNAKLTELDLSDNAFGPNGIKGAVNLLSSPACFSLKILTLNNVGLGIGGAKVPVIFQISCVKFMGHQDVV